MLLKCWVLTEEKLNEISARLGYSSQKSLTPCTGNQSFKTVSINCHINPETVTIVMHELQPHDSANRLNFCD
jgi:hypothetical protein